MLYYYNVSVPNLLLSHIKGTDRQERVKCKIFQRYWQAHISLFRFCDFTSFFNKNYLWHSDVCVSFQDTLFPYVKDNVEAYLKENFSQDDVKAVVAQLREQAIEDVKSEVDGAVAIADEVIFCLSNLFNM